MRLNKDTIQMLLDNNEGFSKVTHFSSRNFKCDYTYCIKGGQLLIREHGKTSWADSRFDDVVVATLDQTRRFLRDNIHLLKTDVY